MTCCWLELPMARLLIENNLAPLNKCFVVIAEDDASDLVYGSSNAMVALTDDGSR